MSYGTYDQYDSRWGKKNYNGSSTMATAGCGPTSCANILHNIKASITPITTMKFMQNNGYAIRNQGTAHAGIPACLKHFGAKDVKEIGVGQSMTDVWANLKKGYAAIFLMRYRRGLPGPTWTTSGHFIAITDYKYKNKKHYVKVQDSGSRGNDGWFCYETQMRGWIPKVWVCKAKPDKPKKIPEPVKPKVEKNKNAKKLVKQMEKLAWAYNTPKRKWKYKTGHPRDICKSTMRKYGYDNKAEYSDCGNFVNTVVREAGIDKHFTSLHGVGTSFPKKEDKFDIVISGRKPETKELKAGDIIRYKKTNGQHAMFYYGDNKVCDAGHYSRFANIRKNDKRWKGSNVKASTVQVLRVKE